MAHRASILANQLRCVNCSEGNSGRFEGQVAVITGGARGIGFGIATGICREGGRVVLVDVSEDDLTVAAKAMQDQGFDAEVRKVDVTQQEQVQACVERVLGSHGKIDILVQAAGITGKTAIMTEEVPADNFDLVMDINVKGVYLFCKSVLPSMKANRYGRIVNIASISGKEGNAGMLAYSTSKAAVIGLSKVVGKECAETGVTCNCVAPAVIRTAMVDALPDTQVTYMTDKIPMKRCGTIDEIANLVLFAASRECSFTTGFCFDATGGRATY
eukprot:TRINITY_DN6632_c0_g1_i1.p1 TRINITY_DN6632_c0_g1~~TRINITY_DN6632_c0_g1_i1.p1  ORF type:complete len:272 (-),score=82.51 TRINITY_DN6632_c0_g1_i1:488-1303(-)